MAGIRDDSAGNYGQWDSSDLSWLDFIKATGSDVGNGAYNALSNITGALSPIGTSPEGNMSLQVPPMITGIADSYRRLSDPTGPGNAYRLTGVPELDAPIQKDMSDVLLSFTGGQAIGGLGRAALPKRGMNRIERTVTDYDFPMYRMTDNAGTEIARAQFDELPNAVRVKDLFVDPSHRGQGVASALYGHIQDDLVKPMTPDYTLTPDGFEFWKNSYPEAVADYRFDGQTYRQPGPLRAGAETGAVESYRMSGGPNRDRNVLWSDTGKPSIFGSALATAGEQPKGALGAGVMRDTKGVRPEPNALQPKAEAMGGSDLAETRIKASEDAYVNAFKKDIEENKYKYFNDWRDDPENPIVVDEWGNQQLGAEISDLYDSASPYGYRGLIAAHPAVAQGLNEAAIAAGRDLYLSPSSNSGSYYGKLKTPAGNEYKVRVADHAQTSSKFDAPDYNIAPGEMTPEEFARLMPTLLSDNKPSLLGAALATAGEQQPVRAYHGTDANMRPGAKFKAKDQGGYSAFYATESPDFASHFASDTKRAGKVYPLDVDTSGFVDLQNPEQFAAVASALEMRLPDHLRGRGVAADMIRQRARNGVMDWAYRDGVGAIQDAGFAGARLVDAYGEPSMALFKPGTVRSATTGETLFSDTGKPSIFGAAAATAGEQPNIPYWLKF